MLIEKFLHKSTEQNVAQRLNSKHKIIPIGCTENTENKKKNFSRSNVGSSLYLMIMMMDDSTTFQEEQIQNSIMEKLLNELALTYLQHCQSTLMMKWVAQQVLRKWPEIFSTFLEIYSLDVEVIMGAEINELKHLRNVTFKGAKEKQLIELNECRTLIKFLIFGKIATSNGKTVFCK